MTPTAGTTPISAASPSRNHDLFQRHLTQVSRTTWFRRISSATSGDAIATLIAGLSDPDHRVRTACADVLDHGADARCVAPLIELLADPEADVRRHAVHAIGCQGCKLVALPVDVIAHLIERAMRDASLRVRQVATHMLGVAMLGTGRDARAARVLRTIVRREPEGKLRRNARWSLEVFSSLERAAAAG